MQQRVSRAAAQRGAAGLAVSPRSRYTGQLRHQHYLPTYWRDKKASKACRATVQSNSLQQQFLSAWRALFTAQRHGSTRYATPLRATGQASPLCYTPSGYRPGKPVMLHPLGLQARQARYAIPPSGYRPGKPVMLQPLGLQARQARVLYIGILRFARLQR